LNTQNNKKYAAPVGAAFCLQNHIFVTTSEKSSFFVSFVLFIVSGAISLFIHISFPPIYNIPFRLLDILFGLLIIIFTIFFHEFLHYLTYRIFKVPSTQIRFGFNKKTLSLFCYCKEALRIGIYRLSLMIPFIFSGVFPLLISIIFLNFVYSIVFSLLISICSSDIVIFIKSLSFYENAYVIDAPVSPGFYVESRFKKQKK
jgi:hypothetical protein